MGDTGEWVADQVHTRTLRSGIKVKRLSFVEGP